MSMQTPIKAYNKHKEIMIKNTYKPKSYQFRPKMNPPSSYLNHLLKPKGSNSPVSNSLNLNSHNIINSFNNEQQFNTFRSASKKNKKYITHYQNNSEYYNLPLVNHRYNLSNAKPINKTNGTFFKLANNNSRQINLLNYNNVSKTSFNSTNYIIQGYHSKSQSISYENTRQFFNNKVNKNSIISPIENKENIKPNKTYRTIISKYSCKSKPGYNMNGNVKTNQDSFLAKNKIFGLLNYSVFGVFDGHGVNGHFVSRYLKDYFGNFFTKTENYLMHTEPEGNLTVKKCYEHLSNLYFIRQACASVDEKLKRQKFDTRLSGSTGVIIVHIEDKIICFNVGDSRAIYINDLYEAVQISKDHKPNLPEEKKRIQNMGGRVDRIENFANIGPFRVWNANGDVPGLAMSRSFGDFIGKSVGVINDPDYFELSIVENKVRCVILASDGLFEFISNETIAEIASPFIKKNDCAGATRRLVDEAYRTWTKDGVICDDITVIVILFKVD